MHREVHTLAVCGVGRSSGPVFNCKVLHERQRYINRMPRSLSTLHRERAIVAGGPRFESRSGHQLSSFPSGRGRCLPDPFQFIIRLPYHSTPRTLATDSFVKEPTEGNFHKEVQEALANPVTVTPDRNMKSEQCCSQL